MTMFGDVREFHKAVDHPFSDKPIQIPDDRRELRMTLIAEEFAEVMMALTGFPPAAEESLKRSMGNWVSAMQSAAGAQGFSGDIDLAELSRQIVDLHYVLSGTSVEYGLPETSVWNEVHDANMRKVDGPKRADGKQQRPEGWEPPNVDGLLSDASVCGVDVEGFIL